MSMLKERKLHVDCLYSNITTIKRQKKIYISCFRKCLNIFKVGRLANFFFH